jgi:retinol dehydrogenase 12
MDQYADMNGKVCLITGATDGIGRVTAETLARACAAVVIVGRSPEKTAQVAREIKDNTGSELVDFLVGDLSSQAGVRELASAFRQRYDRLDVLVNNAGGIFMRRETSVDGIEMTFALNHLAYFLLTDLLLDLLINSAPARIINVSSGAHVTGKLNVDEIKNPKFYNGWTAYSNSKLANIAFTYELARRLQGTGVTANVLHPGFVATKFGRSNGSFFDPLFRLFQLAAISPEKGAQTIIYLASSPQVEDVTGQYFYRCNPAASSRSSYDETAARRLWEYSLELTSRKEEQLAM